MGECQTKIMCLMKKKMKLEELKVNSFITENLSEHAETVKGGGHINPSLIDGCRSALIECAPGSLLGCDPTIIYTRRCSWDDGCATALGCTF